LTLKYKYADFEQHTRSKTISGWFSTKNELEAEAKGLLHSESFTKGIRLLGLTFSNFQHEERNEPVQLTIEF
ncbi:MAG: DNA polymerase IV, partial [Bacteroidales bacterium]|nr:DNA polymerase IV [Bacteroidales bacterium]